MRAPEGGGTWTSGNRKNGTITRKGEGVHRGLLMSGKEKVSFDEKKLY